MLLNVAVEQVTIELEAEAIFERDKGYQNKGYQVYGKAEAGKVRLLLPGGEEIAIRGKKLHQEQR
jgi:hypothetical protein